jgi:hypothetical protein
MELNKAILRIIALLGNDVAGKCYVASEAIYHLAGGKEAGLKPVNLRHEGVSHWYLVGPNNEIIDVTVDQFKVPPDYSKGRGRGFLTKEPCRRTKEFMGT